jgi:UDP-glucuronate 4-epimerase
MKLLITGGSGFVGRNLITYLLNNTNYEISYCDNENFSTPLLIKNSKLKKICNDISEIKISELKNVDTLIHLAAVKKHNIKNNDYSEIIRTNILETNKLFRNACEAGVRKIIFASSLYANGNFYKLNVKESELSAPSTLYGNTKLFGEGILRELSDKFTNKSFFSLRFYFIYGPHQYYGKGYPSIFLNIFNKLLNNKIPLIKNDGRQKLDYLYIDDLCALIVKVIKSKIRGYEIINASSSKAIDINQLVKKIIYHWGDKKKNNVKYSGFDFTNHTFRSGNNKKAQKFFDWKPRVTIDEGIINFIKWFKDSH